MFHKVLESKSGAATENRVTRPLCRTWRRHPVGPSGPRFTPPSTAARRPQRTKVQRGQASSIAAPLFRGGARGSAAEGTHTRNTQRHQRRTTPSTSRRSQLYHRSRRCRTAPPPATPAAAQASRDLYLAALQHISSISAPPSQQPTPDEPGLSDLKSRKDHHGMFSHHVTAFSIRPSPPTNRAREGGGASGEATQREPAPISGGISASFSWPA